MDDHGEPRFNVDPPTPGEPLLPSASWRMPSRRFSLNSEAIRAILPGLYRYAAYKISRYRWGEASTPDNRDLVHDAILDAVRNTTGAACKRKWNRDRVDLKSFLIGHVRSNTHKMANLHSVQLRDAFPDDVLDDRTAAHEMISLSDVGFDVRDNFSDDEDALMVLTIVVREFHYSCYDIVEELQWDEKRVRNTWRRIRRKCDSFLASNPEVGEE
jgi:DNA-directed RNA polymerase specialized sigma24 family protein